MQKSDFQKIIFFLALIIVITYQSPLDSLNKFSFIKNDFLKSSAKFVEVNSLRLPPENSSNLLRQVLRLVDMQHVAPNRINTVDLLKAGVGALRQDFAIDIRVGFFSEEFGIPYVEFEGTRFYSQQNMQSNLMYLESIVRPLMSLIAVQRRLPQEKLVYSFLNGLLQKLDPHSNFLNPEEYRDLRRGTLGQFGGIGIVMEDLQSLPIIRDVIPQSAAAAAGLTAGDVIIRVGQKFVGFSENSVLASELKKISANTATPLWIYRPSLQRVLYVPLRRGIVETKSVDSFPIENRPDLLHIKLSSFSSNVANDLQAILDDRLFDARQKIQGIILDLRGNPGGLLDEAIQVANLFISNGKIVSTKSKFSEQAEFASLSGSKFNLPMIVLVNASSASAAEIVAGALKDHNRALIIGERTYGKGSVQSLFEIGNGSALKLTMAHYFTPNGHSLQGRGVIPHIGIKLIEPYAEALWMNGNSEHEREEDLAFRLDNPEKDTASIKTEDDEYGDTSNHSIWADAGLTLPVIPELANLDFSYPLTDSENRAFSSDDDTFLRVAIHASDWLATNLSNDAFASANLQNLTNTLQKQESKILMQKIRKFSPKNIPLYQAFFSEENNASTSPIPLKNFQVQQKVRPIKSDFQSIFSQFSLSANRLFDCCTQKNYFFELENSAHNPPFRGGLVGIRAELGRESPVLWTTTKLTEQSHKFNGEFELPKIFRSYLSSLIGESQVAGFYFKPNMESHGQSVGKLLLQKQLRLSDMTSENVYINIAKINDFKNKIQIHIPIRKLNPTKTYHIKLIPLVSNPVRHIISNDNIISLTLLSTQNLSGEFELDIEHENTLTNQNSGLIGGILLDNDGNIYAKWPLIYIKNRNIYTGTQLATLPKSE